MNNKVIMFIPLIFLFFIYSCIRDTSPIAPIEIPEWLVKYIEEIEDNPFYRNGIIYLYQWEEYYYYDVISPYRSCIVCEVYYSSGELVSWENESVAEYIANRKRIKIVWQWKDKN
jgi:hypothetical protein